jgi:ppGpp synthetase/RelA/SpoT-type nucleotidyltranferase
MIEKVKLLLSDEDKLHKIEAIFGIRHMVSKLKSIYATLLYDLPLMDYDLKFINTLDELSNSDKIKNISVHKVTKYEIGLIDGEETILLYTTYEVW